MGLLDALSSDEAKLGLGLLAAGGYSPTPMSTGQRLQMALAGVNADKQNALKMKLLQSQMDENASQNQLRQAQIAQQGRTQQAIGDFFGQGGAPSMVASPAGAPPAGAASPEVMNRLKGMPIEKVAALKAMGGPDLIEAWKIANVPTQFSAGSYAYTPGQQAEYLPDPTKGVGFNGRQITMLPGSENIAALAGQSAGAVSAAQSGYKPIKVFNPQTQREEFTSEGAVVGNRPLAPMAGRAGNVQSPGYSGGDRNGANAESILVMQNELKNPALTDADRAGIQREIARMKLQSGLTSAQVAQSGNFAAGPSASEAAQSKANEARAVDTAKADVVRDTDKQKAGKMYGQISGVAQQAMRLLDTNPTGSGAGALADSALNFIGQPTKAGNVAQSLEAVAGWMVANVPRMEGPQSNVDVMNYQTMAGRVGDRTLPAETRKAALREVIALQNKYAELNGSKPEEPASSGLPSGWSVKVK